MHRPISIQEFNALYADKTFPIGGIFPTTIILTSEVQGVH